MSQGYKTNDWQWFLLDIETQLTQQMQPDSNEVEKHLVEKKSSQASSPPPPPAPSPQSTSSFFSSLRRKSSKSLKEDDENRNDSESPDKSQRLLSDEDTRKNGAIEKGYGTFGGKQKPNGGSIQYDDAEVEMRGIPNRR